MDVLRSLMCAMKRWKLIAIIYCFQLLLVLTLGLQVFQVIEASLGNSMSLERMIYKFDYTILQDLFNIHGASLSPLIGKIRWYVLSYMVFSAFINSGIWNTIIHVKENKDWTSFWTGGAKCFGRFLILGFLFTVLLVIWSAIIWAPYAGSFFNMMETWLKDSHIIWLGLFLFILWIHGVAFFFVWGAYSRISIVSGVITNPWKAFLRGFKLSIRRFFILIPSLWMFAVLLFLLYFMVIFLESNVGITSTALIMGFFVLQQLSVWLKIAHRIGVYDYLYHDYQKL